MKKLFIHHPIFRLLSPFATGALVYTLILLINNNLEQLIDNFLGEEVYICVGISFLIQELSRISIVFFKDVQWHDSFFLRSFLQFLATAAVTSFIVTLAMNIYFRYFLGYSPNFSEIVMFNFLFSFVTLIYWLLYTGHQLLYMINNDRLLKEEQAVREVELRFQEFKNEINTDLLFEYLENLLVVMREDHDKAENLSDQFAMLYRYMLARRGDEVIDISSEIETVLIQAEVYNNLPYRKIKIQVEPQSSGFILPQTLLKVIEKIVKTSIVSDSRTLDIKIETAKNDWIVISYQHSDKLNQTLDLEALSHLNNKYSFYSDQDIVLKNTKKTRSIFLPKLQMG